MRLKSRRFQADGSDEGIEIVDDSLIEAIELRSPLGFEPFISFEGAEEACRERSIDPFEELQEHQAYRVALRKELIASRVRKLGDKTFGSEFREIIAERGERVVVGGAAERFDDGGMDFCGGEGIGGRDVCEAYKRTHQCELPRVVELEAGNALSG